MVDIKSLTLSTLNAAAPLANAVQDGFANILGEEYERKPNLEPLDKNGDGFVTAKEIIKQANEDGYVGLKTKLGFIPWADRDMTKEEYTAFARKHGFDEDSFSIVASYDGDEKTISEKDLNILVETWGTKITSGEDAGKKGFSVSFLKAVNRNAPYNPFGLSGLLDIAKILG